GKVGWSVRPGQGGKWGARVRFLIAWYGGAQPRVQSPRARVMETRTGMGGFPEGWAPDEQYPDKWARRLAVDFVGSDLKAGAPKGIGAVSTRSRGEAQEIEVLYVELYGGLRRQCDWCATSACAAPVDKRRFLRCQGEGVSEAWLYRCFPPAPD
ncbi:glucan biosynthesis protein, partial [Salmonella enterica]|uniref:glucan biosynthesis protein n=1 Tax=Salmonella enterica TaxID=28901 RepID=UPI00398C7769